MPGPAGVGREQEQAGLTEEENLEGLYRTEAEIQEAETLLQAYEKDRQKVQGELSRCEENLAGNPLPDLDLLEQAHWQAEQQYHDLRERMGALAEKMDSLIKSGSSGNNGNNSAKKRKPLIPGPDAWPSGCGGKSQKSDARCLCAGAYAG